MMALLLVSSRSDQVSFLWEYGGQGSQTWHSVMYTYMYLVSGGLLGVTVTRRMGRVRRTRLARGHTHSIIIICNVSGITYPAPLSLFMLLLLLYNHPS